VPAWHFAESHQEENYLLALPDFILVPRFGTDC